MALPGIRDILPDHLFNKPSTSLPLPPPPPASLPLSQPVFSQGIYVPPRIHDAHRIPLLPPGLSHSSRGSIPGPGQMPLMRRPRPLHEETINEKVLTLDNAHASRFIYEDLPGDISRHDGSLFVNTYTSGNEAHTSRPNILNGASQENKKHTCPTCRKGFNRPSSLRIHANTHTGAKPYPCPFPGCGRLFSVSSNMRRHLRSHTSFNPTPSPVGALSQNGSEERFRAWPSVDVAHATHMASVLPAFQPDTNPATVHQPHMNVDTQRYGNVGHLLNDESIRERTLQIRQLECDAAHEVHYEHPYPPYVSGQGVNTHTPSSPATPSRLACAQPGLAHPHPMVENWARVSDQDYYYRPQGHYQPVGIPAYHAGSVPNALSLPFGKPDSRRAHYGLPPTPPYTSEAAFSPPAYASGLSPKHSVSQLVVRRDNQTAVPGREKRQRLTPDTPDRLSSEVCDNPPGSLPSGQEEPSNSSFKEQKLVASELEDRRFEVPAKRPRTSLSLSELLHPTQESHSLHSDSSTSTAVSHFELSGNAPEVSPTPPLPPGSLSSSISASARAIALESDQSDKVGSQPQACKRTLGTTPGTAPSPPYPLIALPTSVLDESEDNLKTTRSRRDGPTKPRKRRKRR